MRKQLNLRNTNNFTNAKIKIIKYQPLTKIFTSDIMRNLSSRVGIYIVYSLKIKEYKFNRHLTRDKL